MGGQSSSIGTDQTFSTSTGGERSSSRELAEGSIVGEYRIESLLGEGGMGRVYAATHPVIGKRAAIKILHPELSIHKEAVDRFVQEARAVNQIGHPNIVDIFSFGTMPDGRSYFVMEWLRGQSLRTRMEQSRLPLLDVLQILETVSVALEAAHEKGIIHRDLKPDNIFLVEVKGDKPQVKLLDFGIAKLTGGEATVEKTRTGNLMGTPAYISPEQARGHAIDHRTDIYALGAVAYEMLTNDLVFPADNAADMIAKHLFAPPPSAMASNPEVPPELDELVKRLLAKKADERPSLEQFREELRAIRQRAAYLLMAPHDAAGGYTEPSIPAQLGTHSGLHTPAPGTRIPAQLTPPPAQRTTPPGASVDDLDIPPKKSKLPFLLIASALGIAIGVVLVIATRKSDDAKAPPPNAATNPPPTTAPSTPTPTPDPTNAAGAQPSTESTDSAKGSADPSDTAIGSADTAQTDDKTGDKTGDKTSDKPGAKPTVKKPPKRTPKDKPPVFDPDAPM